MSNRDTDILQIKKYLAGELDAKAMHQLERRAQDDPFLMDAIEGYENIKTDPQYAINELSQRLNKRLAIQQRRIIPWNKIAIAASVIILFSAGGLWFYKSRQADKQQLASSVKLPTSLAVIPINNDTVPPAKPDAIAAIEPNRQPEPLHKAHTVTLESKVAAGKPTVNAIVSTKVTDSETENDTSGNRLDEMVVMDYSKRKKDAATPSDSKLASVSVSSLNLASANIMQGKVIGKDDGLPIPGATVKVKGTNVSAVTDVNGRFVLPKDSTKTTLAVGLIGYQSAEVDTRNSLPVIALRPAGSSLNEVVTSGFAKTQPADDVHGIEAHPQNGWKSFKKYMADGATSSDGKKGIVKVSFQISAFGEVSDIKVLKSLSPVADKRALELINNGPRWVGNTNGKAETVTVRVKFDK